MAKATYLKRGATPTMGETFLAVWDKLYNETLDQFFRDYPWLSYLKERMDTSMAVGSEQIQLRALISENPHGGALDWEEPVSMDDFDPFDGLLYYWKLIGYGMRHSFFQKRTIRGDGLKFNSYEEKRQATISTIQKLLSTLTHRGSGGTGKEIDGLTRLIPATAPELQTVVIGNQNPSAKAWWRTQYVNMAGFAAASDLENKMLELWDLIRVPGGKVDVIVCDIATRQIYEKNQIDFIVTRDVKIADNNYELCQYKRKPIIDDTDAEPQELRMIDNRGIKFCVDPEYWLKWTGEKEIPDVMFSTVQQIAAVCNMVRLSARWLGCLDNITETGD